MANREASERFVALAKEMVPIMAELSRLDAAIAGRLWAMDSEAIHLAACHAEWSAKRAALIAKFFQEV